MSSNRTDRSNEPWRKQLDALIAGPYAGFGGKAKLAQDLGITPRGLTHYLTEDGDRRDPRHDVRRKIMQLWRSYGLDKEA
ncbi:MAG: hypothetical protein ACYC63_09445 [Armatimonadota bacterium]